MKLSLRLVAIVALATLLAACQHGQDISFDGHSVSLHAGGHPTATITSRGSFSVGSKLIDITPAERQLFLRYYNRIAAIHGDTQSTQQAGLDLAGSALHVAGASLKQAVTGHATSSGKAASQALAGKSRQVQQRAQALCHSVQQARALQATLAQQVPAFKPYAGDNPAPKVHCGHDITVI